jgi:hypothetical protein
MAGDGMNSVTMRAFRDEMTKIAILSYIGNAIRTGWHGPDPSTPHGAALLHPETGDPELAQTWFGHGRVDKASTPGSAARAAGAAKYKKMGPFDKVFENVSTLGGATKHLPVGTKSLMLAGTAAMLPSTLKKEDPSGQGRSRAERLTGLAGSTVGGLFGVGAMLNSGRFGTGTSNIAGGIGGSMLGERIFTAPWRHRRKVRAMQEQQQQQQAAVNPQGEVAQ